MEIFGVIMPDNEDDKSYQRQKDKDIYDNNKAYQDIVDKKVGFNFYHLVFFMLIIILPRLEKMLIGLN